MIGRIMRNEIKGMVRDRRLLLLTGFVLLLLGLSAWAGQHRAVQLEEARALARASARAQWDDLGDYNPHGAAHFGTYAYKPVGLLSSLDQGVQPYTGNVLRLEGHVQNELMYAETALSSSLTRLGYFQPALILQMIVPLLLVFLAFGAYSREREDGLLKLLVLQGARPRDLIFGKAAAYWLLAMGILFFVLVVQVVLAALSQGAGVLSLTHLSVFALLYGLYFGVIALGAVYVSARSSGTRASLVILLSGWLLWVVLLPKLSAQLGETLFPLPSKVVFDQAMREDRRQGIDGHNPADARKKALEAKVLSEYGVDSLQALPINFDGILMQEDEEYGNQVWDKHFGELNETIRRQNAVIQWFSLIDPFLSVRNLSMSVAGTDLFHLFDFQKQAEDYRRVFIRELNEKHAYGGSRTGDWSWKADASFFQGMEDFIYESPPLGPVLRQRLPETLTLVFWSVFLVLLVWFTGNRSALL